MELAKLISADVYRDGGSYSASFETEDSRVYNVWLQRSKMPNGETWHHRWLFEYFGMLRPENCLPIVTGSEAERALLARLKSFLATSEHCNATSSSPLDEAKARRLRELIHYIEHREPCFPSDLVGRRFP